MKRPYEVQFIKTSESLRWIILEDAWSVRKDFRWKWQTKLATWLFRKLGVYAREPLVEVERILIDPADIMTKLFEQRGALLQIGHEPKRLLIGSEDFAELMRKKEMHYHFSVGCEYFKGDGRGGRRVMDLEVEVIPWMRGVLVMP
jgi:hypothetical protein